MLNRKVRPADQSGQIIFRFKTHADKVADKAKDSPEMILLEKWVKGLGSRLSADADKKLKNLLTELRKSVVPYQPGIRRPDGQIGGKPYTPDRRGPNGPGIGAPDYRLPGQEHNLEFKFNGHYDPNQLNPNGRTEPAPIWPGQQFETVPAKKAILETILKDPNISKRDLEILKEELSQMNRS